MSYMRDGQTSTKRQLEIIIKMLNTPGTHHDCHSSLQLRKLALPFHLNPSLYIRRGKYKTSRSRVHYETVVKVGQH